MCVYARTQAHTHTHTHPPLEIWTSFQSYSLMLWLNLSVPCTDGSAVKHVENGLCLERALRLVRLLMGMIGWLIVHLLCHHVSFFFSFSLFYFVAAPTAYGNLWARDWIWAPAAAMPDPLTHYRQAWGWNLCLCSNWSCCSLNPLRHSGNSAIVFLNEECLPYSAVFAKISF